MRKINGKLFLYELKKTYLLPLILFTAFSVIYLIDLLFFNVYGSNVQDADKVSKISLYIFYAILLGAFAYREFSTRKIFEKARISSEKLFLIRLLYLFAYLFLFTTLLVLWGTLRMQVFKSKAYDEYIKFDYECLFAYQRKTGLYLLFGAAVGMTGAITYSVVVFIKSLLFSKERWYLKIVWGAVFLLATMLIHYPIDMTYQFPSLGYKEYFSTPIPYGAMTYQAYEDFVAYRVGDIYIALNPKTQILRFDLCWNVTNVFVLLAGLFLIGFAFFSIGALARRQNESYVYVNRKKEMKK